MANRLLARRAQVPEQRRLDRRFSLAASAQSVDIGDRSEVKRLSEVRQSWQAEAWAYRRNVGELRYADSYLSNSCMRLRFHPAAYEPGNAAPSELTTDNTLDLGVPADLAQAALDVMARLAQGGPTAMAQLVKKLTSAFFIAGEGYLVAKIDPVTRNEDWSIRSTSEIYPQRDGNVYLAENPQATSISDMERLNPSTSFVKRLWCADPQWSNLADSPVRAQLGTLEELLLLSRDVRATARSRIANNGILFVPDSMTVANPSPDSDDDEQDPFTAVLMSSMTTAMANEGSAAAVAPVVIRGPEAAGALIKHITFARDQNKFNIAQRSELIKRLATGVDLPAAILTGLQDANHWSAWAVSDDMFRHHVEPYGVIEADALTAGYMWPQLDLIGRWPPELVRKVLIWYDATELVTHPDRAADASTNFDRGAIGRDALRKYTGMTDEDAPNQIDAALYILKNSRGVDPAIVSTMLKQVAKDIDFPDVQPKGGNVEVDPATGQPIGPPPAPTTGPQPAAPPAPAQPNDNPGPPRGAAVVSALMRLQVAAARRTLVAATPEPRVATPNPAASRRLLDIDRDLRARVQTAANAAIRRVLEQAGARVISKARTASTTHIRDAIRDIPKALIPATLGRVVVASLGITEQDLMAGAFADLEKQWHAWIADGQKQALRAAARIAGVDVNAAFAQLQGTFADDAAEGWAWLAKKLQATTAKWLTTAPLDDVQIETTDYLSAGLVRAAIGVAGGFGNGTMSLGLNDQGQPADPTEQLGGIGTGDTIGGFLTTNGASISGYTWVHGGVERPFPPHDDLDGTEFTSFDDPVLANDTGFPDGAFYYPGDHDGCQCDFYVTWSVDGGDPVDIGDGGLEAAAARRRLPFDWDEDAHPRGPDGKFGPGDGSADSSGKQAAPDKAALDKARI